MLERITCASAACVSLLLWDHVPSSAEARCERQSALIQLCFKLILVYRRTVIAFDPLQLSANILLHMTIRDTLPPLSLQRFRGPERIPIADGASYQRPAIGAEAALALSCFFVDVGIVV